MTATATSRESYHKLPAKQIPSEAERCLAVFAGKPHLVFSHRDVACATGLAVNVAQSRCNHIKNKKWIIYKGDYYDFQTKRQVQKYGVTARGLHVISLKKQLQTSKSKDGTN